MTILSKIIENDILVFLALTAGVLWLARKLERRKYAVVRGTMGTAVMFVWLVIINSDIFQCEMAVRNSIKYIVLYVLTVLIVYETYQCHTIAAVFYATAAYCLQNGAAQIWAIISDEKLVGDIMNNVIRTIILILSVWLFGKFLDTTSTAESYMEKNTAGKRMTLLASVLILVITVILQIMCYRDFADVEAVVQHTLHFITLYMHVTSAIISYLVLMLTLSDVRKSDAQKKTEITLNLLEKDKSEYDIKRR